MRLSRAFDKVDARTPLVTGAVALAIILFFVSVTRLQALGQMHLVIEDGGWWESLSSDQQFVAVESALSAFQTAYYDAIADTAFIVHPDSYSDYMALVQKADHKVPQFSHTFVYYQSAITDFYVTHEAARKALVASVLGCLADNPTTSCANVAREAEHSQ